MDDQLWDDVIHKIDQLVIDSVEAEIGDLSSIISLHDKIVENMDSLIETGEPALIMLNEKAAEMAMSIVLQENDDPEETLDIVIETIGTIQGMCRELMSGGDPSYVPIPEGLDISEEELFPEKDAPTPSSDTASKPEVPVQEESKPEISPEVEPALEKELPSLQESGSLQAIPEDSKTVAAELDIPMDTGRIPKEECLPEFEMGNLDKSHLTDFLMELDDIVVRIEEHLLILEGIAEHPAEIIHELMGGFHTIKGISGIIQLKEIIALTHEAEVKLEEATFLTPPVIDVLLNVADVLKSYSRSLTHYRDKGELLPVPKTSSVLERLQFLDSTAFEKLPTLDSGSFFGESAEMASATLISARDKHLRDSTHKEVVKIDTTQLDEILDTVGELVITQSMLDYDPVIAKIEQPETVKNLEFMGKTVRRLQKLILDIRMVPVQGTFQAMQRVIRDLAREQNKKVEVFFEGTQTELDRNIIDSLYNAIVHLIRNAVDHGIEAPEQRVEKEKQALGRIALRAYHHGSHTVIEIQDDGQGIQVEKIREKAKSKGLIPEGDHFSDQEVLQLIFHPGFSTAEEVTEVSGRGIGLDVVKKNVEKFQGQVEVFSRLGEGTTFQLRVPITLAIIDGMLIRVDQDRYIIPLNNIEEFVSLENHETTTVGNTQELLILRGETVPLFPLRDFLPREKHSGEYPKYRVGVIVSWENHRCCLMVDELMTLQQVVIKGLGDKFEQLMGVSGAAILGDGCVGLIIDVQGIIHFASKQNFEQAKENV